MNTTDKRRRGIARSLVITPLGEKILRQVAAGTYRFGSLGELSRLGKMRAVAKRNEEAIKKGGK